LKIKFEDAESNVAECDFAFFLGNDRRFNHPSLLHLTPLGNHLLRRLDPKASRIKRDGLRINPQSLKP
jgi:hypothetical protein